jgi:hypothetical protein
MARTLKLVNGSDEVDLLVLTTPGMLINRGGSGPTRVRRQNTFAGSNLSQMDVLKSGRTLPVTDTYRIDVRGSSMDNVASQVQTLQKIVRKSIDYATTQWQDDPTYLVQQGTTETNTRYAKVLAPASAVYPDPFDQPFENNYDLDSYTVQLVREPFFRSGIPGVFPTTPLSLNTPGQVFFSDVSGTAEVTSDAAINGAWGFEVDATATASYGQIDLFSNETIFVAEFELNPWNLTMPDTTLGAVCTFKDSGTGNIIMELRLTKSGTNMLLRVRTRLDSGSFVNSTFFNINTITSTDAIKVKTEWAASTGPGNDDGYTKLYVDDVERVSNTGVDNDTYTVDRARFLAPDTATGISGSVYFDDINTKNTIGGDWDTETDFESNHALIQNYQATTVLTHIFNYDNGGASFSSNLKDMQDFELFDAAPAVGDIMYFGAGAPFFAVMLNIITAGDMGITAVVELSDGGATWTAGGGAFPVSAVDSYTGALKIQIDPDTNWATETVNGVANKYWMRVRITAVGSGTVPATHGGGGVPFTGTEPAVRISSEGIAGDQVALAIMRIINQNNSDGAQPSTNVLIGQKSRGLDNFLSRLNGGGDMPTGWITGGNTDTTQTAASDAPGGFLERCTFATDQTMITRSGASTTDANIIADYVGTYRVFVNCNQTAGNVGDVSIRFVASVGSIDSITDTVSPTVTGHNILLELGEVSILQTKVLSGEVSTEYSSMTLLLQASATSATPNLDIYDIVLIPIDELVVSAYSGEAQSLAVTDGTLLTNTYLQFDSDIIRHPSVVNGIYGYEDGYSPLSLWEMTGSAPRLEPARDLKLFYLFSENRGTLAANSWTARNRHSFVGTIYVQERWQMLRGAD